MRTKQTILEILLFLLISCVILASVWYAYLNHSQDENSICPDQLKRCPDGSFVELGGPLCNYPKCPSMLKPPASEGQGALVQPAATLSSAPAEVANSFYTWYQGLKPAQKQKSSFEARPDISDSLKAQMGHLAGGADPLLCGLDKIVGVNTASVFANASRAQVLMSFIGVSQTKEALVELVNGNGSWQINEIFCQSSAATSLDQLPALSEDTNAPAPADIQ